MGKSRSGRIKKKARDESSLSPTAEDSAFMDLCSRFILNLPAEERKSSERVFFQLEQAHWFYEDYLRVDDESLAGYSFENFCLKMLDSCDFLESSFSDFDAELKKFKDYRSSVPVSGSVILNGDLTKVLLVKSWFGKCWGFPKGKINRGESLLDCAIRETIEEVGYDVSSKVSASQFLDFPDRNMTLFVIPGVDEKTVFETRTKKEISAITWFDITELVELVGSKKKKDQGSFWNVRKCVFAIESWVKKHRSAVSKSPPRSRSKSGSSKSGSKAISKKIVKSTSVESSDVSEGESMRLSSSPPISRGGDTLTFGSDLKRWSPQEMFLWNEKTFGLKEPESLDPDYLSRSMAMQGSGYKRVGEGKSMKVLGGSSLLDSEGLSTFDSYPFKFDKFPEVISPSSLTEASDFGGSRDEERSSEFRLDAGLVMQALVTGMKG